MQALKIKDALMEWTVENSGAEARQYLGMSSIGMCARLLYNQMVHGRQWTQQQHLYCYEGYLHERDILARLAAMDGDLLGPGREFSDFDGRFQGHSDGELAGHLLEIKSTTAEKMPWRGHLPRNHYWQVQTYMHYGGYSLAFVIYKARDTGEMYVARVELNPSIGVRAKQKARRILDAVDRRVPPGCECGRCR